MHLTPNQPIICIIASKYESRSQFFFFCFPSSILLSLTYTLTISIVPVLSSAFKHCKHSATVYIILMTWFGYIVNEQNANRSTKEEEKNTLSCNHNNEWKEFKENCYCLFLYFIIAIERIVHRISTSNRNIDAFTFFFSFTRSLYFCISVTRATLCYRVIKLHFFFHFASNQNYYYIKKRVWAGREY